MIRLARYAAIALIVGLVVVLTLSFRRDPRDIRTGTVGKPAAAFDLPALDGGGRISLETHKGHVVVLNFWSSWCVPCKEENPALTQVWERYRSSGDVLLIGIVFQDSVEAARDYTARLGNTWPSGVDADGRVALAYGVFGPPETYFIGPDGVVAGRHIGPIDAETLVTGIETLRTAARK